MQEERPSIVSDRDPPPWLMEVTCQLSERPLKHTLFIVTRTVGSVRSFATHSNEILNNMKEIIETVGEAM